MLSELGGQPLPGINDMTPDGKGGVYLRHAWRRRRV